VTGAPFISSGAYSLDATRRIMMRDGRVCQGMKLRDRSFRERGCVMIDRDVDLARSTTMVNSPAIAKRDTWDQKRVQLDSMMAAHWRKTYDRASIWAQGCRAVVYPRADRIDSGNGRPTHSGRRGRVPRQSRSRPAASARDRDGYAQASPAPSAASPASTTPHPGDLTRAARLLRVTPHDGDAWSPAQRWTRHHHMAPHRARLVFVLLYASPWPLRRHLVHTRRGAGHRRGPLVGQP